MSLRELILQFVERLIEQRGGVTAAAKQLGIAHQALSAIRLGKNRSVTIKHLDQLIEANGWTVEQLLMQLVKLQWEMQLRGPDAPFVPLPNAQGKSFVRREFADADDDEDEALPPVATVVPIRR